eukprot:TRINITY_DN10022_c0_g1_i1.p2 TRINITY_DN10022_c0_g1~~TRINITY_DN10022_c0_g1_i1.p2  ORF type:complete len:350 (-),score=88.22 TRINITY_DN10022_c0_g1_i1:79-1128(-)
MLFVIFWDNGNDEDDGCDRDRRHRCRGAEANRLSLTGGDPCCSGDGGRQASLRGASAEIAANFDASVGDAAAGLGDVTASSLMLSAVIAAASADEGAAAISRDGVQMLVAPVSMADDVELLGPLTPLRRGDKDVGGSTAADAVEKAFAELLAFGEPTFVGGTTSVAGAVSACDVACQTDGSCGEFIAGDCTVEAEEFVELVEREQEEEEEAEEQRSPLDEMISWASHATVFDGVKEKLADFEQAASRCRSLETAMKTQCAAKRFRAKGGMAEKGNRSGIAVVKPPRAVGSSRAKCGKAGCASESDSDSIVGVSASSEHTLKNVSVDRGGGQASEVLRARGRRQRVPCDL